MSPAVIQVGVGLWGRSWAELVARARGFRLAAVVDAGPEARRWAAESLGVPTFTTLQRALDAVPAEVVLLISPPETHRPLAETAFAAGRHVVVEKPLASTMDDAVAIVEAARAAKKVAMVGQNYRFRRQSRTLGRLLAEGALGDLRALRIDFRRDLRSRRISPRDWRGRMAHPLLLDMSIHHVDLLRSITGTDLVEVDARSWRVGDSPFAHDPSVAALLTLADGTPVSYTGTWSEALGRETSWNGDWELVGSAARATWTGGVNDALRGTVRLERYGSRSERPAPPPLPVLDRLAVLHEARRAIRDGVEPECSAADNLRTLAAVLALARSTELRAPVAVQQVGSIP
ncbi:MAG: Gfo/Idh/MocA family protein [Verrucomicrobiota bacterium]